MDFGVTLVAIGTELTDGEIANSNAAVLSRNLLDLGCGVSLHLVVPDQVDQMVFAIETALRRSKRVVITGGLGPTSDDFTREVVAKVFGLSMHWREESWTKIQSRLMALGVPVSESNRQQCYFPEGATVFENPAGTADAFYLKSNGKVEGEIVALPGPPGEIAALWKNAVGAFLGERWGTQKKIKKKVWKVIGKSESDVAERIGRVLAPHLHEIELGYRAHRPYVEVKVKFLTETGAEFSSRALDLIQAVETELQGSVLVRDLEDVASMFLARFPEGGLILDGITQGLLFKRLSEVSEWKAQGKKWTLVTNGEGVSSFMRRPVFVLENSRVGFGRGAEIDFKEIAFPFKKSGEAQIADDRYTKYMMEMAIAHWLGC